MYVLVRFTLNHIHEQVQLITQGNITGDNFGFLTFRFDVAYKDICECIVIA